jgi:hypothetical protein
MPATVHELTVPMRRLHVYLAGPLSAPDPATRQAHIRRAIQAGVEVYRRGHFPFIPHLTQQVADYLEDTGQEPLTYGQYIDWDLAWLAHCDVLYYLGDSRGALLERLYAFEHGIPVISDAWGLPFIARLAPVPEIER